MPTGELIPVHDNDVLIARHMTISTGYLEGEQTIALHIRAVDLDEEVFTFVLMVDPDDAEWLGGVMERVTHKLRALRN